MSTVEFIDHSEGVLSKIYAMGDMLAGSMAAGVEVQIKTSGNTPIDKGFLRSSARTIKVGEGVFRVIVSAGYAAAQEAGFRHDKNGNLVEFKNHPRGGGAHYFQKAIDTVKSREADYVATAQRANGLAGL